MKSAILKNGKIEIINKEIPTLNGKTGAIIKVDGCGLCGSDIVKINHNENEANVILGHEVVGEIVDINVEIKGNGDDSPFKKGDIVALGHHFPCFTCKYCKHGNHSMCETFKATNIFPSGFSEYIYASEGHLKNTMFKKPSSMSVEEFSFLEPLSCCIRAIRRAGLELNKDNHDYNVLILGLGSIGLLMAQGAKAFSANVFGLDINEERQKFAKNFEIEFDPKIKYDIIFMTSGSNKAIPSAFDLIEKGGKIVVFSSIPTDEGYKNNEIYYKELQIIGSYSPEPLDLKLSYDFLKEKRVQTTGISTTYDLNSINNAVIDTKQGKILKAYIKI